MTQIIVYEDTTKEYSNTTIDSTTVTTYYEDEKHTIPSTKLLGKYRKTAVYSFENSKSYLLVDLYMVLKDKGQADNVLDELVEDDNAKILSVEHSLNPSYNPKKWQKLYDKRVKEVAKIEKSTEMNVW